MKRLDFARREPLPLIVINVCARCGATQATYRGDWPRAWREEFNPRTRQTYMVCRKCQLHPEET